MRYLLYFILAIITVSCISIKADVQATESSDTNTEVYSQTDANEAEAGIRLVMKEQETAWNNHDLEGFMQGYWNSEDLKFYSASGLTKGWDQTLANYKKNYPTKAESGILKFTINDISRVEDNSYYVMGEFYLTRDIGHASGFFIIIFRKINGEWKIIADMTA
ncbi:YybH family protein [Winogradskyella aurantiaca]|uniref:YybH family protein n=1 Tax=Winogradskyella aurantiaca TaxID=2219558 RepID=UPI000E1DC772|nr:nuclear transport factor 2 family protein [Winogradskyella aurantiaca]